MIKIITRIIFNVVLPYFVYRETGIATAIFAFLIIVCLWLIDFLINDAFDEIQHLKSKIYKLEGN